MSVHRELLYCALRRARRALTAGDVLDEANALAMSAGWPDAAWKGLSPPKVAALLRNMPNVRQCGRQRDAVNGAERPLWEPVDGFDAAEPLPGLPRPARHPLEVLSREQIFVLFDVLDQFVECGHRQRIEIESVVRRQQQDIAELTARVRRQLAAVGLPQALEPD